MLNIGDMNARLIIKRSIISRNAHGGNIRTWDTIATRWGKVHHASGVENIQSGKVTAVSNVDISIRNYKWLMPSDRIYWTVGGVEYIYEIQSVVSVDEEKNITKVSTQMVFDNY